MQETFLAALKGGKSFPGRSAEKSWLAGILKNKICDHYRKAIREISFTDLEFYSENNLWVMLHRARMALRRCLETNWSAREAAKP